MKTAAIYARVSRDKRKEEKTIASQTAALTEFARKECRFQDLSGHSFQPVSGQRSSDCGQLEISARA